MTEPLIVRFRDAFRKYLPPWLADRPSLGKTVGFRFLWVMIGALDAAAEVLIQGLQAAWPGLGTPTALPLIGRSRSLIRGEAETEEDYTARLRRWLETHQRQGSSEAIATAIHYYLSNRPRVRVVNRYGDWVTCEADGTITTAKQAFDWDSVSHPERHDVDEPWWSEVFIIVYPPPWTNSNGTYGDGEVYGGSLGLGHANTQVQFEAVKGLIAQWKSAHTNPRCVIWTTDAALFDPADPLTLPDGTWGSWGLPNGNGPRVPSGRNRTTCRYWEPGL